MNLKIDWKQLENMGRNFWISIGVAAISGLLAYQSVAPQSLSPDVTFYPDASGFTTVMTLVAIGCGVYAAREFVRRSQASQTQSH